MNSSRSSKFGLLTSACAKKTRCFSPPERVPIDLFSSFIEFVNDKAFLILSFSFLLSHGRNPFDLDTSTKIDDSKSKNSLKIYGKSKIGYIDEKKIKIVTPGIDLQKYSYKYSKSELENIRKKYNLPKNYILYLGTIEPRKNIERIVKAFKKYKKEINDDLKLVIVGRKGWKYDNIMKLIESMGTDIILTGYIDEEDKIPIYKLAQIFAFPSLYEGFGMPVLEAMAAGVPVVTSNVSSLPEVAGDAAILVDPLNEDEIFEAYKKILSDKKLQLEMIEKGLEQAKKFEWKESAKVLEQIYEKM